MTESKDTAVAQFLRRFRKLAPAEQLDFLREIKRTAEPWSHLLYSKARLGI